MDETTPAETMEEAPGPALPILATYLVDKISSTQLEREIQWKADAAQQDERKAAKTKKWIPKAIAALEAAGTPKDVDVSVGGPYYDMDIEAVARAVKKAGWSNAHSGTTYYGPRPAESCDCVSVALSVGSRKAEITKHCTDARHRDRQVNDDHVAEQRRREEIRAKVGALETRIAALLEASSIDRVLLCLIAGRSYAELPELLAFEGDIAETRALAAAKLAAAADSTYAYGERRAAADQALDNVLTALGAEVPTLMSPALRDICTCHRHALKSNECIWCGRPSEPVRGVILEQLYPGQTTCTGCGRRQVHCTCVGARAAE